MDWTLLFKLSTDLQPRYHLGAGQTGRISGPAQGRLLELCTSKGSQLTCRHTEELRAKGPTRALPRDSAESPGLLNLSNVEEEGVMRGTFSLLPGHTAYL